MEFRRRSAETFVDPDTERNMNNHLSIVQTPRAAATPSRAEQVLGGLPYPLIVVQMDRRLVFLNAAADAMFPDGLASQTAQRLISLGQLDVPRLEQVLRQAGGTVPARAGLWFKPSLRTGWLSAAPLASSLALGADWPPSCLLLTIHLDQTELSHGARIEALCQLCKLTGYVLMLLADGPGRRGRGAAAVPAGQHAAHACAQPAGQDAGAVPDAADALAGQLGAAGALT